MTASSSAARAIDVPPSPADYRFLVQFLRLAALVSVAIALWRLRPVRTLSVQRQVLETPPAAEVQGLPAGASATWGADTVWTIPHPGYGHVLLAGLASALLALAWAVGCLLVSQVVSEVARGRAFSALAVRRLRQLATLVLGTALLGPFVRMGFEFALAASLSASPGLLFAFRPAEFLPVIAGLLLLVVAEAFRRGRRLEDDVEGLV